MSRADDALARSRAAAFSLAAVSSSRDKSASASGLLPPTPPGALAGVPPLANDRPPSSTAAAGEAPAAPNPSSPAPGLAAVSTPAASPAGFEGAGAGALAGATVELSDLANSAYLFESADADSVFTRS